MRALVSAALLAVLVGGLASGDDWKVPKDWRLVEAKLYLRGAPCQVAVLRSHRQASITLEPGTDRERSPEPLGLSPHSSRRLERAVARAGSPDPQVLPDRPMSIRVDGRRVDGVALRRVLRVVALSAMFGSEPTTRTLIGESRVQGRELFLDLPGLPRPALLTFRPELEVALARAGRVRVTGLVWSRAGREVAVLVTEAYLHATPESLPRGISSGQDVRVVGLERIPLRAHGPQARVVGGLVLRVEDAEGRRGRLEDPRRARPSLRTWITPPQVPHAGSKHSGIAEQIHHGKPQ